MIESLADFMLQLACRVRTGGVIVNEHVLDEHAVRKHVDLLGRHFEFIHHDELAGRVRNPGRQARGKPFCLLTFDDGKRSNATVVAPILEELGVPAAFYVCTHAVTSGEPLWFEEYYAIMNAVDEVPEELQLKELLAQTPRVVRDRLNAARRTLGVELDAKDDDVMPMNWDHARRLTDAGFTIGAHGVRHVILPRLSIEEARQEIVGSIGDVSRELGIPCRTFAFPNGNYSRRLAECAMDAGAETVMTTEPTWIDATSALWRCPRVQLSKAHSLSKLGAKLAVAATGRILKNPDGSGRFYARREDDTSGRIAVYES